MMTRVGSSSIQAIIGFFTCLDGLIIKNENSYMSHENPNNIPRL
jgi:hypothetical protein